ncbi:MAG TPA: Uma2 family endonuclease [Gemmataceae bacterium]|nr:Uma2 family endonuclease [Gemmataceae bacterium]
MTAIASLPANQAAPLCPAEGQRFLLHNVSWQSYRAIGEALRDRPGLHLTYDRGTLEFMTLSPEHERCKVLLRRLIEVLAEELNLAIGSFGSTTYQREDLEKGLEPDECYYLRNLPRVRGKRRLDLTADPPPDFVIEVDITRSSIDRLRLYAAFGVPEVWRFDGTTIHVLLLTAKGEYEPSDHSPTFPMVPIGELVRFMRQGEAEDDTSMVRAFRAWVRRQLVKAKPDTKRKPTRKRKR